MAVNGQARIEGIEDPMRRQDYLWRRWGALKTDRGTWDPHAKELARWLLPRASRFTTSDTNKGGSKHNQIYDNTGLRAARTLAAGMMSGVTSPARPWFRLKHADDDLMEFEPVKVWCSEATRAILGVFAKSNIYRTLHQGYTEQGVFGTHAALVLPNARTVLHSTSLTFGEYAIACDAEGTVDTLYREMAMTASSIVREFGFDNCTRAVQQAYRTGNLDVRFDVVHAVEPNLDADPSKLDWRNMPWRSVYFEVGGEKGKFLREGGFRRFRGLCPRWAVTSGDIYGESPGMEALGDTKQLQHEQYRKAQAIDYQTQPPVGLPTSMKGAEVDLGPGGVSYFDMATQTVGQRQLFDVNLDISHLTLDIQDVRGRINEAFYVDLFSMISQLADRPGVRTATEIAELHEEKLLMLGPVLERQQNENLNPLIDMAFDELMASGVLPPAPPELDGQPLETELLGVLAQAQRAVQTSTIDRFITGVAQIAAQLGKPEVADKVDGDRAVEIYGDDLGVDPRILTDDKKVAAIRQSRAAAQAEAADQAKRAGEADIAHKLGGVATGGGASNVAVDMAQNGGLVDPIGSFSGYQSPQAERLGV